MNSTSQSVTKELEFAASKIFPGSVHHIWVMIPVQYTDGKPACVYLQTDGYPERNEKMRPMLEQLIAAGEMPVTIAVFVSWGTTPAPMPNTMERCNRGLEYDRMDDLNARFLVEEILPFVARQLHLNLSASSNDRCMAGSSSGGMAAFFAAWSRPDLFSRVYANSPSFVAFRGGDELPAYVRKYEARPIRVYMTTGTHDANFAAGDWYIADQEMDSALKFSGYDYRFRVIDKLQGGVHGAGYFDCFPEAMRFLWKDWPKPVQAGPGAPRVQDTILAGESWQLVAQNLGDVRQMAGNASGEVFFVDVARNQLNRIDLDGKIKPFVSDSGQANALAVGPRGEIYTVSRQTGKVMSYTHEGQGHLLLEGIQGNAILATHDGNLYITTDGDSSGASGEVWLVKGGKKTKVDSGLKIASGMTYRPDQWLLSVADEGSKWIYSYVIRPDGTLSAKERYFRMMVPDWEDDAGATSLCYSKEGPLFVATRLGIQLCANDGPVQAVLPLPDRSRVNGVCLGGRDGDTLFACCGDKIWKHKVKNHAVGAFSPWMKFDYTPF